MSSSKLPPFLHARGAPSEGGREGQPSARAASPGAVGAPAEIASGGGAEPGVSLPLLGKGSTARPCRESAGGSVAAALTAGVSAPAAVGWAVAVTEVAACSGAGLAGSGICTGTACSAALTPDWTTAAVTHSSGASASVVACAAAAAGGASGVVPTEPGGRCGAAS